MRLTAAPLLPRAASRPASSVSPARSTSIDRAAALLCRRRLSPVTWREERGQRRRLAAFDGDDAGVTVDLDNVSASQPPPPVPVSSSAVAASWFSLQKQQRQQGKLSMGALLFEGRALLLELSELFTASELQIARGEELAFVRRAFPLLRRWSEFNGRILELDAEAEAAAAAAAAGAGQQQLKEEAATMADQGEQGPSAPSPSLQQHQLLLPSELLWRELHTTFLGSLEEFASLSEFNDGVLAWARVLEDEMSAALGGAVDLLGGSGASSSSSSPSSASHPTAAITGSLVSAARASRDLGVRARVKAALRVRRKPNLRVFRGDEEGGGGGEEQGGGGGKEDEGGGAGAVAREQQRQAPPSSPTLAAPSAPERAPKLARAAWRDQRVMLVLYALAAIGELPEREHDEALATLLLKKLSDLRNASSAAGAGRR